MSPKLALTTHTFPPQPNVIAELEAALAQAKAGAIVAVGIALVERTPQGDFTSIRLAMGKRAWWSALGGAIARLAYALNKEIDLTVE